MRALHTHEWGLVRAIDPAGAMDPDWVATNDVATFNANADPGIIQPPSGSDGRIRICVMFYHEGIDPAVDPITLVPHGQNMSVDIEIIQLIDRMRSLTCIVPPVLLKLETITLTNQGGNEATLGTVIEGIQTRQVLGVRFASINNAPVADKVAIAARIE